MAEGVRSDVDAPRDEPVALRRRERAVVPDDVGDRIGHRREAPSSVILRDSDGPLQPEWPGSSEGSMTTAILWSALATATAIPAADDDPAAPVRCAQRVRPLSEWAPHRLRMYYTGPAGWWPVVPVTAGSPDEEMPAVAVIPGRNPLWPVVPYRPVTPEVAGSSPVAPIKIPANKAYCVVGSDARLGADYTN